jgi:hypothetical protein
MAALLIYPTADPHNPSDESSDDNTRKLRQPKTRNSAALLMMPSPLEATLRNYLKTVWKPNPADLLFPNRKGTHPRWRDNVVKYGLKPVLRKLGIPERYGGCTPSGTGWRPNSHSGQFPCPIYRNRCGTLTFTQR